MLSSPIHGYSTALTTVKGRKRCPDSRCSGAVCVRPPPSRASRASSRPTARTAMPATPWPATHTHGHTRALYITAPDRGTASTQVYILSDYTCKAVRDRVPPRVAVSVRTDLASAAHSAPRPSAVGHSAVTEVAFPATDVTS